MKKIFILCIAVITMILSTLTLTPCISAAGITNTKQVTLSENQKVFTVQFDIQSDSKYSGAEFGVQCPDGITIKTISYSIPVSSVGPTEARGLIWFGFFTGSNSYNNVTATLTLEYTGEDNIRIILDNYKVYSYDTKNNVKNESKTPHTAINIYREGATNTIPDVDTPLNPGDNQNNQGQTNTDTDNGTKDNGNKVADTNNSNNSNKGSDTSSDPVKTGDYSKNTVTSIFLCILSLSGILGLSCSYIKIRNKTTGHSIYKEDN